MLTQDLRVLLAFIFVKTEAEDAVGSAYVKDSCADSRHIELSRQT